MNRTTWGVTKTSLGSGRELQAPWFGAQGPGGAWAPCVPKAPRETRLTLAPHPETQLSLFSVSELDLGSPRRTRGNNLGSAQGSFGIRNKAFLGLSKWMELFSANYGGAWNPAKQGTFQ